MSANDNSSFTSSSGLSFTPTQDFNSESDQKGMLLFYNVGCHAIDTPILMYDGTIKLVQNIIVGDVVMGDDSTPRTVLSIGQGEDDMYEVSDQYNNSYTVNSGHILCLKTQGTHGDLYTTMELNDFIKLEHKNYKGYRTYVNFPYKHITVDPYLAGLKVSKTLNISYKINSFNIRIQTLAGILDKYATTTEDAYILDVNIPFKDDVLFLARSLGFCAYIDNMQIKIIGLLNEIPVKQLNKPNDTFNILESDIQINYVGKGDYYGFTLDKNHKYVMGDFTVTHNTCVKDMLL
jgi:hypothetical protein